MIVFYINVLGGGGGVHICDFYYIRRTKSIAIFALYYKNCTGFEITFFLKFPIISPKG